MSEENDLRELALMYTCEYCLARPGVWCRTLSGANATGLHSIRTMPIYSAFGYGYQEAEKAYQPKPTYTYQPDNTNTSASSTTTWVPQARNTG